MLSSWRTIPFTALLAAVFAALVPHAQAGPVPGVETFTRRPVEFPVAPGMEVWEIGDNDFLVTFSWKPQAGSGKPHVVGTFNGWNRDDLPMEGPDADGIYRVTARIRGGDYTYKFYRDGVHYTDPANPAHTPDELRNSILRLGITALLGDAKAARGDGRLETRAFHHNPDAHLFYDVFTPKDVTIRFRTLANDAESVTIRLVGRDGSFTEFPMVHEGGDSLFEFYEFHHRAGRPATDPVAYTFRVQDGVATEAYPRRFPLVLDAKSIVKTPEWARHAVWYQIMVERFHDGDPRNNPEHTVGSDRATTTRPWKSDFYAVDGRRIEDPKEFFSHDGDGDGVPDIWQRLYGGDFEGLMEKLDYLKSLGVNSIYLCPVFEAHDHHKYGARSYVHADDGFGVPKQYARSIATEDLKDPSTWTFNESDKMLLRVIEEVHRRDMRIILDGVFNHLGDRAEAFQDVKKNGRASRYAEWFDVVSWEPFRHRGWAGSNHLPQFAKTTTGFASQEVYDHVFAVTKRWMDPNGDGDPSDGIDGWRLDVPMDVPKPFWVEWRRHVKSINPDAYIVGEVWDPAEEWLDGTAFDAVMNYQFAKIAFRFFGNVKEKTTATQFDRELGRLRARYPRACTEVLQNLYDSHDTDRWVSQLMNPDRPYDGGNRLQDVGTAYNDARPDAQTYRRQRLMAVFQATNVGAPMIFYGTEQGMYGADDPRSRGPMWWPDMMPYDNPDYRPEPGQEDFFRRLFQMRKAHPVLATGDFRTLLTDDAKDCIVYERFDLAAKGRVVTVLNNSATEQELRIPAADRFGRAKVVFGEGSAQVQEGGRILAVKVPPVSGLVLAIP